MNTASGFLLYLVGSFALVIASLEIDTMRPYLGAFVIFLFMGGFFFAWLNTIRQTNKMNQTQATGNEAEKEKEKEAGQHGQPSTATQA